MPLQNQTSSSGTEPSAQLHQDLLEGTMSQAASAHKSGAVQPQYSFLQKLFIHHALPPCPIWDTFSAQHGYISVSQTRAANGEGKDRAKREQLRNDREREKIDLITQLAEKEFSPEDLESICGIISKELASIERIKALAVLAHSSSAVSAKYGFIKDQLKIIKHRLSGQTFPELNEEVKVISGLLSHLDCMEKSDARFFIYDLRDVARPTFKILLDNLLEMKEFKALLYLVANKSKLDLWQRHCLDEKVKSGPIISWIDELCNNKISYKVRLPLEEYEGLWLKGEQVQALNNIAEALKRAWLTDISSPSLLRKIDFVLDIAKDLKSPSKEIKAFKKIERVDLLTVLLCDIDRMESSDADSVIYYLGDESPTTLNSLLDNLINGNENLALLYLLYNKSKLPIEHQHCLDNKVKQIASWIRDLSEGKISPNLSLLPEQYKGLWLKGEQVKALNTVAEALMKEWQVNQSDLNLISKINFVLAVTEDLKFPVDKINVLSKFVPYIDDLGNEASENFIYTVLNLPLNHQNRCMKDFKRLGGGGMIVLEAIEQERGAGFVRAGQTKLEPTTFTKL
jgi:hypothetical protein